jgi:hypothetical protein
VIEVGINVNFVSPFLTWSVISLANQHTVGSVTATPRAGSAHSAPLAANNRPIFVSPPATCRADG